MGNGAQSSASKEDMVLSKSDTDRKSLDPGNYKLLHDKRAEERSTDEVPLFELPSRAREAQDASVKTGRGG